MADMAVREQGYRHEKQFDFLKMFHTLAFFLINSDGNKIPETMANRLRKFNLE